MVNYVNENYSKKWNAYSIDKQLAIKAVYFTRMMNSTGRREYANNKINIEKELSYWIGHLFEPRYCRHCNTIWNWAAERANKPKKNIFN